MFFNRLMADQAPPSAVRSAALALWRLQKRCLTPFFTFFEAFFAKESAVRMPDAQALAGGGLPGIGSPCSEGWLRWY
ncbi:MAG: hypothetical protein OEU09_22575, partial [Rhodospirillales bacterium]|nr:hypothetical protein [Rhodospirillales bacterium]